MPPAGNSKSSFSDDDGSKNDGRGSHHSQGTEENEAKLMSSSSSDDSSGEKIDCDTPEKDEESGDRVVISPEPTTPSDFSDMETPTSKETTESSKDEKQSESGVSASAAVTTTTTSGKELFPKNITTSPSFVTAGLQKKATPWAIKSWAALALTLDGRDKITKVLQYSCRLLGWWLAAGPNKNTAARFTMLYKSLAISRKAFRLGRSFIEFEKIRSMGLVGLIFWHLEQAMRNDAGNEQEHPKPKIRLLRKASSNIGWGPDTAEEDEPQQSRSLTRSLSNIAYRKMYRPLLSHVSSTLAANETPSIELWKAIGSAIKMLGLLGFWACDNTNFLLSTGALDDMSISDDQRVEKRTRWQSIVGTKANQAYFGGSLAGLLVNWYAYLRFRCDTLPQAEEHVNEATSPEDLDRMVERLKATKEKQFSLFLALLKSCCDIIVFSNMPGIDLHKRFRGKKNNEGLHCICGLISASTVLYNNFPDNSK